LTGLRQYTSLVQAGPYFWRKASKVNAACRRGLLPAPLCEFEDMARTLPCKKETLVFVVRVPNPPEPEAAVVVPVVVDVPFFVLDEVGFLACKAVEADDDDVNGIRWETVRDGREGVFEKAKTPIDHDARDGISRSPAATRSKRTTTSLETPPLLQLLRLRSFIVEFVEFVCYDIEESHGRNETTRTAQERAGDEETTALYDDDVVVMDYSLVLAGANCTN
jgi:hypothetical protein